MAFFEHLEDVLTLGPSHFLFLCLGISSPRLSETFSDLSYLLSYHRMLIFCRVLIFFLIDVSSFFWSASGWGLITRKTKPWLEAWNFHPLPACSREGRGVGNGVNDPWCPCDEAFINVPKVGSPESFRIWWMHRDGAQREHGSSVSLSRYLVLRISSIWLFLSYVPYNKLVIWLRKLFWLLWASLAN